MLDKSWATSAKDVSQDNSQSAARIFYKALVIKLKIMEIKAELMLLFNLGYELCKLYCSE